MKCQFHENEMQFLGFVISAYNIKMKEKKIEAVKIRLEPKFVRDIQKILDFSYFYRRFIRNFGKIAVLLTLMLGITYKSVDDESRDFQLNNSEKNQDISGDVGDISDSSISERTENLSTVALNPKNQI